MKHSKIDVVDRLDVKMKMLFAKTGFAKLLTWKVDIQEVSETWHIWAKNRLGIGF